MAGAKLLLNRETTLTKDIQAFFAISTGSSNVVVKHIYVLREDDYGGCCNIDLSGVCNMHYFKTSV